MKNIIKHFFLYAICIFFGACSCTSCTIPYNDGSKEKISNHQTIEIKNEFFLKEGIQDGCIYDDTLFLFRGDGVCWIYDLPGMNEIGVYSLPSANNMIPHSNSVCFGKKYDEGDRFPLLYTNVYNNYEDNPNSYGTCFVYRILNDESNFVFSLIQIIKISFTNDLNYWYKNSENISPFGNFQISGNNLFVYVNIFGANITRFFKFDLPATVLNGESINYVYLTIDDIKECFDTTLFEYIQGGVVFSTVLFSLEGFGSERFPGRLRIVELNTWFVLTFDLNELIGGYEPEFIDFYDNSLIIGMNTGEFFCLGIIDEVIK